MATYANHVVDFYLYSLALAYRGLAAWLTGFELPIVAILLGAGGESLDMLRLMVD